MTMRKPPRVAVFVDMLSGYGREILIGINRYIRTHGPWMMYGDPERVVAPIEEVERWGGDGIIAHVYQPRLRSMFAVMKVPVVNVSQLLADTGLTSVLPDNQAVGRLAAAHLLERGYRNFAFCGFTGHRYGELRCQAMQEVIAKHGFDCQVFNTDPPHDRPKEWEKSQQLLADWVKSLPKPVGLFCCNDARTRHVARVCEDHGVRVPEEVALLGVDNDELVCDMSNPPLSSIDVSAEQVGYEAAALLDRLMHRHKPPTEPILIPPMGVVRRRSTDVLAIPDEALAKAVRFIHDHAFEGISVEDVVATVPVSRRVLERRFRSLLERTIGDEITAVRLDHAKALLIHSDHPTSIIAERSGYQYIQQFNVAFKRRTGMTPTSYRRQFRAR